MTTLAHPAKPSKGATIKRWVLWLALALIALAALLFSAWYVLLWGGWDAGPQKLVYSIPCGTGEYKLLAYQSEKGNGHIDLVDRNGKVYGSFPVSSPATVGTPSWDADCRGVELGNGDNARRLEAPR